jgi:hypothetical protein
MLNSDVCLGAVGLLTDIMLGNSLSALQYASTILEEVARLQSREILRENDSPTFIAEEKKLELTSSIFDLYTAAIQVHIPSLSLPLLPPSLPLPSPPSPPLPSSTIVDFDL